MRAQRDCSNRPIACLSQCLHALRLCVRVLQSATFALHTRTHTHINDNMSARQSIYLSFSMPPSVFAAMHTHVSQAHTLKNASDVRHCTHRSTFGLRKQTKVPRLPPAFKLTATIYILEVRTVCVYIESLFYMRNKTHATIISIPNRLMP